MPSDGKYFQTSKRGEIHELKEELHIADKGRKKEAVKKVIAAMTLGKDVSALFPDVVNCMQTTNIELKKLVYLYILNYAKSQPELAILAINTFRKDAGDSNALLRALAVRTMGCIRIETITEYLLDPLRRACRDTDPYVRKTAAICVAKVYEIAAEMVEDQGFLDLLRDMVNDANPMVVSNAVAALSEIGERLGKDLLRLDEERTQRLLGALNECNEWGQVFVLDAIAHADIRSPTEAERVIERVTARLSHANPAVVLSSIKVVLTFLDRMDPGSEAEKSVCKKLSPPLITLLSSEAEIVYVVLRNLHLVVQRRPALLANDVKVFFCKYNDPAYVKFEKLDIIVSLVTDKTCDAVLGEMKEYATEVDVDFSRKAIKAMGRIALKLPRAVERCLSVFGELLSMKKSNHVIQESITMLKDVFRKYPQRYDSLVNLMVDSIDQLDEPDSKAAMIWVIGEHAERITKPDELLEQYIDEFQDEPLPVQLQLLTAAVKLYLKMPEHQGLVTGVLTKATEESDNPDLRDRAYIYWRMLSTNPDLTKVVVLGERPPIVDEAQKLPEPLLEKLFRNLAMMASVYHKAPEEFVTRVRVLDPRDDDEDEDEEERRERMSRFRDQIASGKTDMPETTESTGTAGGVDLLGDLLDMGDDDEGPAPSGASAPVGGGGMLGDLMGGDLLGMGGGPAQVPPIPKATVMPATQPGQGQKTGLEISARVVKRPDGAVVLELSFANRSPAPLSGWALQLNKNPVGLACGAMQCADCAPGATVECVVPMSRNQAMHSGQPLSAPLVLQAAVKTSLDIFYFQVPVDLSTVLEERKTDQVTFLQAWAALEARQAGVVRRAQGQTPTPDRVVQLLSASHLSHVVNSATDQADCVYLAGAVMNVPFYAEVALQKGGSMVRVAVRSEVPAFGPLFVAICDRALQLVPQ